MPEVETGKSHAVSDDRVEGQLHPPFTITPDDLDYALPEELIATHPAEPRDTARMMVVRRSRDEIEHMQVRDLPRQLSAGDLLVFNDTSVLRARLIAQRVDTKGRVEGLYLGAEQRGSSSRGAHRWRAMLKSNGRLREGMVIELLNGDGHAGGFAFTLMAKRGEAWEVESADAPEPELERLGRTPLPPYILRTRGNRAGETIADDSDRAWYQTVYADASHAGSVAAPTAGLHFTEKLLDDVTAAGVQQARVTLHVGPGTFKPVTAATLDEHPMHREWFEVDARAVEAIHSLRRRHGSRLIAVGTTTVRTLESLPEDLATGRRDPKAGTICGETDLLIAPPYTFRHVDGMLTNFHLPRSTLLALVAAMVGLDRVKALYAEAVRQGYRFYSYGDAMLILP